MTKEEKLYKAIYDACLQAINEMGMEEVKKMSWFGNWKASKIPAIDK